MQVCHALLNLDDLRFPRTQTQVAETLGISRSAVGRCVKELLNLGIIQPLCATMRTNILYRPGRNYMILKDENGKLLRMIDGRKQAVAE